MHCILQFHAQWCVLNRKHEPNNFNSTSTLKYEEYDEVRVREMSKLKDKITNERVLV